MSTAREIARFLRWRLVPVRYAGKVRRILATGGPLGRASSRASVPAGLDRDGYSQGPRIDRLELEQIFAMYRPRCAGVKPVATGHPFTNLFVEADITAGNPVFRLAMSGPVLGAADRYFDGRMMLDSIQVLYSWPTAGGLHDSQLWHKDYGDSRSFHWIAYLNDVATPADGPFVFVDKGDTRRIRSSLFIRRIDDEQFLRELGAGQVRSFLGKAGESVFVDPAACYHCGSRCQNARLALFVTFNTDRPFVAPTALIEANRERIFTAAQAVRPDLASDYLRRILRLA